jgi:hypothetical protein
MADFQLSHAKDEMYLIETYVSNDPTKDFPLELYYYPINEECNKKPLLTIHSIEELLDFIEYMDDKKE